MPPNPNQQLPNPRIAPKAKVETKMFFFLSLILNNILCDESWSDLITDDPLLFSAMGLWSSAARRGFQRSMVATEEP